MVEKPAEVPVAGVGTRSEEDLRAFLLNRLAVHQQELEVDKLFRAVVKLEGSDLHLRVGSPPMVRTKGELRALSRGPIDSEEMVRLLVPLMDAAQPADLSRNGRGGLFLFLLRGRHRVAISRQRADPVREHWAGGSAHQQLDSRLRGPAPASVRRAAVQLRSGTGTAGRRHRFGKDDDDRVDAELHQPQVPEAHSHSGGSGRVHLHARQVPDQPAGDRHRRAGLRHRHEARRARRPRRHARR